MATIEMLQRRHLEVTEKEISRAEVLAALMAAGIETTIEHEDFGGINASASHLKFKHQTPKPKDTRS